MPKPANMLHPEWTAAEMNALALLYRAGWRWDAIAAHVSGIYGNRRTYRACQSRGDYLGILETERKGRVTNERYDDDIRDMMLMDYSSFEITEELNRQYGIAVSQCYVYNRIRAQGPQYQGWKQRAKKRLGRCISKSRRKGGRPVGENSIRTRLKAAGIPRRSYYNVREELVDIGAEFTPDDIIQICQARRRA